MNDRVYGSGDDYAPTTVFYTNAIPSDAQTFPSNNFFEIGADELGRINSIKELGSFVCVGKDKKIYSFDATNGTSTPINSRSGIQSHRSVQNVE